jgi:PAS domain S-box-containing protein
MSQVVAPIRVLHVDDDPDLSDLVADFLEREDERFSVETATSAREGLERLEGVDCIVSDYEMPGQDGIEFLETVREEYPDLPFILYTGKGSEEVASDAISAGVTDYLEKESGTSQYAILANRITNAVEQYRASERAAELDRIRRVVRDVNQTLVRSESRSELEQQACEIITDAEPYLFAWIGEYDTDSDTIEPRASAGHGADYLDEISIPVGNGTAVGPTGKALKERELAVTQSIATAPEYEQRRSEATERGYRASAAVPILFEDTVYGVLHVYSAEPGMFDDTEKELLRELGDDIGHALHRIEQDRHYRRLFEESVNGIAIHEIVTDDEGEPVDYVFLEANEGFEQSTGLDPDEIAGRRATEVIPGLEPDLVETYGEVALEGETVRFEHHAEALGRHYDISAFPLGDGQFVTAFTDITDRRERQQELETVLNRMDDAVLVHPPDGTFTFVNRAAIERYGYAEDELLAMAPADLDGPGHSEKASERIRNIEQDGQLVFESEHRTRRGDTIPVEVNATSLTFRGEPAVLSIARDITDRKEYERRLRHYKQAIESSNDLLSAVDENFEYLFANETYCKHYGIDQEEIHGKPLASVVGDETWAEIEPKLEDALGGETVQFEMVRTVAEDDDLALDIVYSPLYGEDGTVQGVGASMRDVTARKEIEARLKSLHDSATEIEAANSAKRVYELLVEAAESVLEFDIAITDEAEGDLLLPRAVSTEISGDQYYEETPIDADDNIAAKVYRTGEPSIVEDLRTRGVDPADQTFRSALTVPVGKHGVFQTVARTPGAYDETDLELVELLVSHARERLEQLESERQLREQRAELERQNERLEEFASVVSHDLRNPLNVARSRTELAQEGVDSEHLEAVERAHDRMETLIENLLSLARERASGVETEPIDLTDVVQGAWQHVEGSEATIEIDADRTIRADRTQLQRLMENLFRNAIEHGGEDVTVTVGCLDDGFYIEDDGDGIPEKQQDQVFEAGYSTEESGTGFGLSIVEQIAEAHGWDIRVTDSHTGGARFETTGVSTVGE